MIAAPMVVFPFFPLPVYSYKNIFGYSKFLNFVCPFQCANKYLNDAFQSILIFCNRPFDLWPKSFLSHLVPKGVSYFASKLKMK